MCDRPLRGDEITAPCVADGSVSAGRARGVIARKLTLRLNDREADVHGAQWTTLQRRSNDAAPRFASQREGSFERTAAVTLASTGYG